MINKFDKYQKGFAPIIILAGILILILAGGGIFYVTKLNTPKTSPLKTVITSEIQKVTPASAEASPPFLQIIDTNSIDETSNNKIVNYQEIFMRNGKGCQPSFFDPQTSKYSQFQPEEGVSYWTKDLYVVEPDNSSPFSIRTIKTNSGYSIEIYEFGCASSMDYILDVRKDQKRVALYTKVDTYYINEGKSLLFLNNYLHNNGQLELKRRIISFDGSKKITIPQTNCVSRFAKWDGDNLITYSDRNVDTSYFGGEEFQNYKTRICAWNTDGKLLHKLQGELTWYGAASDSLWAEIGVLPKDPDIFYAYNDNDTVTPKRCSVYLQSLTNQSKYKTLNLSSELLPDKEVMPQQLCLPGLGIDFDLSSTTFENPFIRYRIKGKDWQTSAN